MKQSIVITQPSPLVCTGRHGPLSWRCVSVSVCGARQPAKALVVHKGEERLAWDTGTSSTGCFEKSVRDSEPGRV